MHVCEHVHVQARDRILQKSISYRKLYVHVHVCMCMCVHVHVHVHVHVQARDRIMQQSVSYHKLQQSTASIEGAPSHARRSLVP